MRILLVDDQADARALLRHWLADPGWEIVEAQSGEDVLDDPDQAWDVLVADHLMSPGMSGIDLARELRARGDERPILVVSAFVPPDLEDAAREMKVEVAVKEDFPGLVERLQELAP